jgi:hypothetical protein
VRMYVDICQNVRRKWIVAGGHGVAPVWWTGLRLGFKRFPGLLSVAQVRVSCVPNSSFRN